MYTQIVKHNISRSQKSANDSSSVIHEHMYLSSSFLVGTTNEHLELTVALKVPTFVVVTKSDLCTEAQMHHTIQQLEHLLTSPGCNKVPFIVKNDGDLCTAAQRFTDERYSTNFDYFSCNHHELY